MAVPIIIEKIYAVIADEKDGEGIMGIGSIGKNGVKHWHPLIGADRARIESHIPYAKQIAKEENIKIKIVVFEFRKDISTEYDL